MSLPGEKVHWDVPQTRTDPGPYRGRRYHKPLCCREDPETHGDWWGWLQTRRVRDVTPARSAASACCH